MLEVSQKNATFAVMTKNFGGHMTKNTIRLTILAAATAMLLGSCSGEKARERGGQENYKTMTVSKSDQTLVSPYAARLTGRQIVEIRPQVAGHITQICINEGQRVKKGQTLFIIDQTPYQAALQVAEANVETARAKLATAQMEYDSSQQLQQGNVVSDFTVKTALHTLNEAKAALAQAKAQELNARNNLSYTVVTSPVDGSASMIPYHVGALVNSNISEPLVTVADDHEIYAYFSITENQALDLMGQYGSMDQFLQQSADVELQLGNGTTYPLKGRINAVSGTVEAATGAITLRAVFPNPQRVLHSGGAATVLLPTRRTACIVIPQEATYELQNRIFVHRIVNGEPTATPIQVYRQNNGHDYIVEQGLAEGDTIVSEGAGLVRGKEQESGARGKEQEISDKR